MRRLLLLAVTAGVFYCLLAPEQASAQLFRRWQDNDTRSNFSVLPGANPNAKRPPDYGAEQVSDEIRSEVNGRAPVGAAPDFWSNAPLAQRAKQYRNPISYSAQQPIDIANRQYPPRSKFNSRTALGPHWLPPYSDSETSDPSDLDVASEEIATQSDSVPTVEL